jgi:hypothetical protein
MRNDPDRDRPATAPAAIGGVTGGGAGHRAMAPAGELSATRGRMADLLAAALAHLGVSCRVEAREGLAIIYPASSGGPRLDDQAVRRQIVALGRERGFTHVAVALGAGTG